MDKEEVNKLNDLNKDIIEEVTSKLSCDAVMEKVADLDTVMEEVTGKISCDSAVKFESPEIQVESHDFDLYCSKTVLYFFDTSESHEIFVESHEIQS
ncbi:hypothetical protein Tco_0674468 [Tanacetum coccineum]